MITKNTFQGMVAKNIVGWLLILPAVLCVYFFVVRPQILGIYWSFFDMRGYSVTEFVGLDNYRRVISDTMFLKNLWNTCQYVVWSLAIGFLMPIILAVCLNEMNHFRNSLRLLVYFPSALPGVAVIMLWFFMFYPDAGGLLNMILNTFGVAPYVWLQDSRFTILYIVIAITWNGAGATAIYYFAALQGVSRELYEAAIIDGANFIKRFFTVALPHISSIILLFFVRQIIVVFSIMEQPLQMTDGGPNGASNTLGLQMYKYGFVSIKPQLAMATGMIMFIILIFFTIFYFYLNKRNEDNI